MILMLNLSQNYLYLLGSIFFVIGFRELNDCKTCWMRSLKGLNIHEELLQGKVRESKKHYLLGLIVSNESCSFRAVVDGLDV